MVFLKASNAEPFQPAISFLYLPLRLSFQQMSLIWDLVTTVGSVQHPELHLNSAVAAWSRNWDCSIQSVSDQTGPVSSTSFVSSALAAAVISLLVH